MHLFGGNEGGKLAAGRVITVQAVMTAERDVPTYAGDGAVEQEPAIRGPFEWEKHKGLEFC